MIYSAQQQTAIDRVQRWLRAGQERVFYLAGPAGTGKTRLAREFASGLSGYACFCAYTGKAAYVLRQMGCPASTIHSLIYVSREKSRERLRELEVKLERLEATLPPGHPSLDILHRDLYIEKENLKRPTFVLNHESSIRNATLVVVDECSMIDQQMGEDLLSFDVPILVLGDPFQLPPVRGEGFFTNRAPDFTLTEIHRQAAESPVLWMATRVREGHGLSLGAVGDSSVVARAAVTAAHAQGAEQILVGRNATRRASNARMRQLRGHTTRLPCKGDRVVCLRNNHELGILNGALYDVQACEEVETDLLGLQIINDDTNDLQTITAHSHHFLGKADALEWWNRRSAEEFDYGYALTVHKSQGSQWNSVLLFDESAAFRADARRWLYTGITRAAQKVTVVQ